MIAPAPEPEPPSASFDFGAGDRVGEIGGVGHSCGSSRARIVDDDGSKAASGAAGAAADNDDESACHAEDDEAACPLPTTPAEADAPLVPLLAPLCAAGWPRLMADWNGTRPSRAPALETVPAPAAADDPMAVPAAVAAAGTGGATSEEPAMLTGDDAAGGGGPSDHPSRYFSPDISVSSQMTWPPHVLQRKKNLVWPCFVDDSRTIQWLRRASSGSLSLRQMMGRPLTRGCRGTPGAGP